ncbi:MAG: dockerin type I domain-containing protein [Clostridia bacterium]
MAAAVLFTGFQGGITGRSVSAAHQEAQREATNAPDTAGLFYSNTICVYKGIVYAIEAGNLTRKTADENDTVATQILTDGLAGAKSLNITEDAFYAASGNQILRIDKASLEKTTAYASENEIKLFLLSPAGDFYTLENGSIYKNGKEDFTYEKAINLFCPVEGGYLFSTGAALDYSVYLSEKDGGVSFVSDAETWYVELDTLVLNRTDGDYMISLADLIAKGRTLQQFNLYGGGNVEEVLADADGDGSALLEPLTPAEEEVNTAVVLRRKLSAGIQNCIARARQMAEVKWTALADFPVFQTENTKDKEYFKAGVTYYGIPYGQPIYHGKYVGPFANGGATITIDEFAAEAANPNSLLYTGNADYNNRIMPTYSNDCSAFVSYCWGSETRFTTSDFTTLGNRGTKYANVGTSVSQLMPGYAMNKSGHIILVYDVAYDLDGSITSVTTIEQTPPIIRKRSWGVGGNYGSIADLQAKITGSNYMIIKNLSIDSVGLTEYASVPLDSADFVNRISSPVSARVQEVAAGGIGTVLSNSRTFAIEGWSMHKEGCASFEYQIDGGAWNTMQMLKKGNLYTFYADANTPAAGTHSVAVRGITAAGTHYPVADFQILVKSAVSSYTGYFDLINTDRNMGLSGAAYKKTYTFANASAAKFSYSGWAVSNDGVAQYEYRVDDGLWLPVETSFRMDVYKNVGAAALKCPAFNAFNGAADFTSFTNNTSHKFYLRGVTDTNGIFEIAEITVNIGNISAQPPAVSELYLKSLPSVTEYCVGDALNTENLLVVAVYADHSTKALYSGFTCDYDFSSAGLKTVTVGFGGKTAAFDVTVTAAFQYGDLNGDDNIDGKDAGLLLQYLAEWDVEVVQAAADVNADDDVDGKDAGLLLQYLADWDVVFGKK